MDDFWHKNFNKIPHITSSFIKDFASANLPIKATQARGYKKCSRSKEKIYSLWATDKKEKQLIKKLPSPPLKPVI